MNSFPQNKWIAGGFGLTVLLMGSVSVVSYKNIIALKENAHKVQTTYEIINDLSEFYASMTVAESGRRGYLATGSPSELERHRKGTIQMRSQLDILKRELAQANPNQQQQLTQLTLLITQRLALFEQSIDLYQKNPSAAVDQLSITEQSTNIREKIIVILDQMKAQEEQLLQSWLAHSRSNNQSRVFLSLLGTILSFAVTYGVFLILFYQWKQYQKIEKIKQDLSQEKQLLHLKSELFSMISHEFRTPLSVILSSSQLLETTLSNSLDRKKLKNLQRIQSSVKLMDQFLTDMLTLTRAESGNLDYKLELLDIESFCLNLVEDMQFLCKDEHCIKLMSQGTCKRLYLDKKLLYSILSNLLLNAIKYSSNGENINLILNCEAQQTIFIIEDRGIGIPLEDQPKIYDPFYRGHNVTQIVGTGLGLAVVKKCIELHRGSIELVSTVGVGTTVTITIPHQELSKR